MSDHTSIEWTDATWNPITGCSVTSPGCKNCYAMKLAGGRLQRHPSRAGLTQPSAAGPVWTGEVRFNEAFLEEPYRWRKPRRIFVCAHGDLFHESVPDEWIDKVFSVMAGSPRHTFQVLTKRAARMRTYLGRFKLSPKWDGYITRDGVESSDQAARGFLAVPGNWPLANVWLGVSVEDQERANERIPELLATPAAVRWISAEPLLGPIELTSIGLLDWVVAGGESGSGKGVRPIHPAWAQSLRDQCAAAEVPFLFKQWGAWQPISQMPDGAAPGSSDFNSGRPSTVLQLDGRQEFDFPRGAMTCLNVGKKAAGRLLDGVEHDGFPT